MNKEQIRQYINDLNFDALMINETDEYIKQEITDIYFNHQKMLSEYSDLKDKGWLELEKKDYDEYLKLKDNL